MNKTTMIKMDDESKTVYGAINSDANGHHIRTTIGAISMSTVTALQVVKHLNAVLEVPTVPEGCQSVELGFLVRNDKGEDVFKTSGLGDNGSQLDVAMKEAMQHYRTTDTDTEILLVADVAPLGEQQLTERSVIARIAYLGS